MSDTETTRFEVAGIREPVEILVDRWGVPHIYAADRADAFFAQGWNAARDRLFQIDLWRRRGNGLLAEVLGPDYLEQDRANRLMLYRGDMETEWAAYGAGVREAVERFTAGINSYVAWALESSDRLPPEFRELGYEPSFWEPADAVRFRTHGLFYNADQEVQRARTMHLGGPEAELLRQAREPAAPLSVPAGIDLGAFGPDTLRTYQLAFAPVSFAGAADPASAREGVSGSNNWVVDGGRTATGRPILANDPHRAVTLPSLRYLAHLTAPGLDVIGAGEPGLPGISIGHNQRVAFGLTIWPADVEDLYVYRLDAADPERYIGPQGSTPFTVIEERVPVRGAGPAPIRLQYTVHGPVIHTDRERGLVVALRAAWLEPGMAPYLASIGYGDAESGDAFVRALDNWGAPAVNQVFATVDGDWGWQVAAKIPRRSGWDGSLPVPGDGGYEWRGFAGSPELPSERRPERGWFASANEENLPEGWGGGELTATHDWYSGARRERLGLWLEEDSSVSIEKSVEMQMDYLSVHARELLSILEGIDADDPRADGEFRRLQQWDGVEGEESREALVFQIWVRRHLRPRLIEARLRGLGLAGRELSEARELIMKDESFGGDLRGDLRLAEWMRSELPPSHQTELLARSLSAALDDITGLLGAETGAAPWSWGRLHHSEVTHPVFAARGSADPSRLRVGPRPRGGSGDTVGMGGYDSAFRQSIGSTFRMVLDVGNWDASFATNSPGQSGDPSSPHYADLFSSWVEGRVFPLVYSEAAVREASVARLLLDPPA